MAQSLTHPCARPLAEITRQPVKRGNTVTPVSQVTLSPRKTKAPLKLGAQTGAQVWVAPEPVT